MKKLIAIITSACLLLATSFPIVADTASVTASGGATNSLLSAGSGVYSITIANGGSASATVRLFNAPSTDLTYTLSAYTNRLTYMTNQVAIYTNAFQGGVTVTNTNTFLYSTQVVTAASTNNYPSLIVLEAPAGQTLTYTPVSPIIFTQGVLVTNGAASGNITITTDYNPFE